MINSGAKKRKFGTDCHFRTTPENGPLRAAHRR
jgi:hypothetical protein